jgi:RHS repeat-associated protein
MVTNALGVFTNSYVDETPRLASTSYPNGQTTTFSYYGTTNDERLQQIQNLTPSGQNLSSFGYAYDADGDITNWTQKADASTPTAYSYGYDAGNQVINAVLNSTGAGAAVLKQFAYGYDLAGNRTSEQIGTTTNAPVAISQSSYNTVNQLTNRSTSGGPVQFAGYLSKQATVTVAGNAAVVNHQTTNFVGYASVSLGTNTVPVVATDYTTNQNSATNVYQLVVTNNGVSETVAYDANGNQTSVITATSTNTYQWDAANRLVSITGPVNQSLFAYDGLGRRTQIIELQNGAYVSTNNFVWDGQTLLEQRDNTGTNVVKRFFGQGEQISGTNYYFTRDHLGSVREIVNAAGTMLARYDYDSYGRMSLVSGSFNVDFAYAGMYYHAPSGLNLTLYRAYNADLGRWISRDPSGEGSGLNLYAYVMNNPINGFDPLGLLSWGQIAGYAIGVVAIGAAIATGGTAALAVSAAVGAVVGGITTGSWSGAANGAFVGAAAASVGLFLGPLALALAGDDVAIGATLTGAGTGLFSSVESQLINGECLLSNKSLFKDGIGIFGGGAMGKALSPLLANSPDSATRFAAGLASSIPRAAANAIVNLGSAESGTSQSIMSSHVNAINNAGN